MWIEILSAVNTPRLKEYSTRVVDQWLAITLKVRSSSASLYEVGSLTTVHHYFAGYQIVSSTCSRGGELISLLTTTSSRVCFL